MKSPARLAGILVLFLSVDPAVSAAEEEPPEPPPRPAPLSGRLDPNDAPLPLLAALPSVGRIGAARIGEARAERRFTGEGEVALLLAADPLVVREQLSVGGPDALRLSGRARAEKSRAGLRVLETVEGRLHAFSFAALAESDPGERRADDFVAWSAAFDPRGGAFRLLAGDIAVRLGSGLLVGTSEPFGQPADFGSAPATRLAPYRSRAESAAHRGVAASLARGRSRFHLLLTSSKRDARVDADGRVSSIDDSGLHRTPSEEARRDRLREEIAAVRWEGTFGGLRAGWTAAGARFDPPLGGGDADRKPKAFRGRRLAAGSVDLSFRVRSTRLEGELAHSSTGGSAGLLRAQRSFGRARALLLFRNFSGRFHAPRGAVYHKLGGEPSGEIGLHALLASPIGGRTTVAARLHRFASFDRTYVSEGRVFGSEWALWADRPAGPFRFGADLAAGERSEVRGGARVLGETRTAGADVTFESRRWRVRADFTAGLSRTPGSDRAKRGEGLSILVSLRRAPGETLALSWSRLFAAERPVAIAAPALPGGFPVAFVGGGREAPGLRFAWKGIFAPPWIGAFSVGPGRFAIEVGIGSPVGDGG